MAVVLVGPRDQLFSADPLTAAAHLSKRKIQNMKNMQTPRQRIQWKLVQVQLPQPSRPRVCDGLCFFYDNDDQNKDDDIGDNDIFEMKC